MDASISSGAIGGVSVGTILGLCFVIYKAVNHTQCRSRCCGRQIEASLDINPSPYVAPRPESPDTRKKPVLPPIRVPEVQVAVGV